MSSQRFRYKDKELKVSTESIDGDIFVMLEDIQHKFGRRILGFTLNGEPLSFMRNSELFWLEPKRIRAHIDQIIDCDECENDVDDDIRTELKCIIDTTQRTLDNTTLLITKADAILRQAYELAEFTMPRLFFILSDDRSRFNPANLFNQSYRLFFLCECDKEHHLAFHEGYEINRPREFLIRYGPYIRNMLKVVSTGLFVGSIFVQQLNKVASQISVPDVLVDNNFWHGFQTQIDVMDNALDNVMKNDMSNLNGSFGKQYLEGVDLREVKSFLKKVDDRQTLGNLYRSTTSDGVVRWLCIHHYQSFYSDKKLDQHKREFRRLGGRVQFDVATIEANETKNIDEMVNILGKGLFVLELILKECKIRESTFDILLSILARNVYIQTFQLKNITVLNTFGRSKSHSNIIAKLEELLTHVTQLTVTYEVHIFNQTRIDMNAFECSLKNTKDRLILHIYSQPAFYLNSEFDKVKCNCQPLLETFLKISETITTIIPSVNNSKIPQFSLITNLQLRLSEFDKSTLQNLIKFLAKKNSIVTLGLSFHHCTSIVTMISNVCEALMNNDRLEKLSLNYCSLCNNTMMMIAKLIQTTKSLNSVDLSNNSNLSFDGAKILAKVLCINHNLKTLTLLNSDFELNKHKNPINKLITSRNTNSIIVNYNQSDDTIKFDKYLYETYATLFLNSTGIEELKIGCKEQRCLDALTSLNMGEDDTVLHTLDISNFTIQNLSEHFLNYTIKNLKNFCLNTCNINDHDLNCIISTLARDGKLESLKLHALGMSLFSDQALNPVYVELALMIQSNKVLKKLEITSCSLGNIGVSALAAQLKVNNTLEELNFKSNMIGTIGAQALATVLQYNKALIELNVSDNEGLGSEGILPMLESLKTNRTLKQLSISGCYDRQINKHEHQQIQNAIYELSNMNEFVTISCYC